MPDHDIWTAAHDQENPLLVQGFQPPVDARETYARWV
jgi:hypothetical protein